MPVKRLGARSIKEEAMMSEDGRVFDRLFPPLPSFEEAMLLSKEEWKEVVRSRSTPPSVARSASESPPATVDVVALIRAIDKLEASIARLKRFLRVDERPGEG